VLFDPEFDCIRGFPVHAQHQIDFAATGQATWQQCDGRSLFRSQRLSYQKLKLDGASRKWMGASANVCRRNLPAEIKGKGSQMDASRWKGLHLYNRLSEYSGSATAKSLAA
jgi:hypothetical protein